MRVLVVVVQLTEMVEVLLVTHLISVPEELLKKEVQVMVVEMEELITVMEAETDNC